MDSFDIFRNILDFLNQMRRLKYLYVSTLNIKQLV